MSGPSDNPGGPGNADLSAFLADPQIREASAYALKKMADVLERRSALEERRIEVERFDSRKAFWLTIAIMVLILGTTGILAVLGHLSSEAVAFIIGGVMGSAFTFLGKYFTSD